MEQKYKKRGTATLLVFGLAGILGAQQPTLVQPTEESPLPEHPECIYFGRLHDKFTSTGIKGLGGLIPGNSQSDKLDKLTRQVTMQLAAVPGGSRTQIIQQLDGLPTIDRYIFQAIADAGITPAESTTDFEFIRRVTLDLTGRVPVPDRVLSFVNDSDPNKRAKLVDEVMAKPEFLDKWTMWFGDLLKNNSKNTQIRRFDPGVKAFNAYIRQSLSTGKPYDQMVRELITAAGANSYTQGELNFTAGGVVTGGPVQDIWDQQTVDTVQTFLGISHINCLLCHNGRGHLDSLSLWGSSHTRMDAWGLASFLSHTDTSRIAIPNTIADYYWTVDDNVKYKTDYPLNTTTGNRPARQPQGTVTKISPTYLFNGDTPPAGGNYRAFFAKEITSDFQFARATVNYFWAEFFGTGIVDPVDQFDLARLDPDNPPPSPWVLQPSNPQLLNALAQDFIDHGYSINWLIKTIANSQAYQLSSRYNGTWNASWDGYFARKFVRRLWSEEVHDAVVQTSGIPVSYNVGIFGTINWAMQLPEPAGTPGGPVTAFLDAFLRGNRDDEERRSDGSIAQALNLMNDAFVMSRVPATVSSGLVAKNISKPDDQLVDTLFLNVLSRYPTSTEKAAALSNLKNAATRTQEAENLLWSLYNKVDFFFNY